MATYIALKPALGKVFQEQETPHRIREAILHQVEDKFKGIEPKIQKYRKVRNEWITSLFEKYEHWGAKFVANLHSTECERPCPKGTKTAIHLQLIYHPENSKARQLIKEYKSPFHRYFEHDCISDIFTDWFIPQLIMIELKNNPFYNRAKRAERITRNFLNFLVQKY